VCVAMKYSLSGATVCLDCAQGKYSLDNSSSCATCPSGFELNSEYPGSKQACVETWVPVGNPTFATEANAPFVGYVVVTLSGPVNSELVYTMDGTDPKCACGATENPCNGPREVSKMLSATTTIKAKSCQTGKQSETVTREYNVQPGPVVKVIFGISGSLSAADIDSNLKKAFADAFTTVLAIQPPERVQGVEASRRRRLLDMTLSLGVLAAGDEEAQDLQNVVAQTDFGSLTNRAGWEGVSVSGVEVSIIQPDGTIVVVTTPAPAEGVADPSSPFAVILAVVGGVFACTLLATGTFYIRRQRASSEALAKEIEAVSASASFVALDEVNMRASTSEDPDSSDRGTPADHSSGGLSARLNPEGVSQR